MPWPVVRGRRPIQGDHRLDQGPCRSDALNVNVKTTARRGLPLAAGLLGSILLGGCGSSKPPDPVQPLRAREVRALPVANWTLPDGRRLLCAGGGHVGADWTLHGSPDDPRSAWMIEPDGRRTELAFAPGWSARFTPRLEVLDATGAVIAREGSEITADCGTADPGVVYPEF
jgi:hypothetical protein